MKYLLVALAIVIFALAGFIWQSRFDEGESGESTVIGNSLVIADFGYARGGEVLTYAIIRSFPTNLPPEQISKDPRTRETATGMLVRDNDGKMIPVGHDGTVYFYDGDHLRTMKVKVAEYDVSLSDSRSMDEVWSNFQHFEVTATNK